MNPLNEQDEPVMKSYNSDPNNFQMNMILVRAETFSASLSAHFMLLDEYVLVTSFRPQKELNQRMNLVMNMVMANDWNLHSGSYKDLKSNARSNGRTSNEENDDLLELFKKTQTKVNSLENEFKKVETENLHQD